VREEGGLRFANPPYGTSDGSGQIEAVRVVSDRRGEKIGEAMFDWALQKCRAEQCGIVQLTTDKTRTEAHRFYDRLGFLPSHVGYKLKL
jgi:GNAT superfamily N-acetyltransferase